MILLDNLNVVLLFQQQMGRRAISLPTNIFAEAPSTEVLYELDKVKKVDIILCVCVRVCTCVHSCVYKYAFCVMLYGMCMWLYSLKYLPPVAGIY